MRRHLLVALGAVAVCAACTEWPTGPGTAGSPQGSPAGEAPPSRGQTIVSAEAITRALAEDEHEARRLAASPVITIRGSVAQVIRIGGMDIVHIVLEGHLPSDGQPPVLLYCTLDDPSEAAGVRPGHRIVIKGELAGDVLGRISVCSCTIVERPEAPPSAKLD